MAKQVSLKRLKSYWPLYLFVLPSALLVGTFQYFPATSAIYHSFFRWDASTVTMYVGWANFREAVGFSPMLWVVFAVWVCLMMMTVTGKPGWAKERAPLALAGWATFIGAVLLASFLRLSGAREVPFSVAVGTWWSSFAAHLGESHLSAVFLVFALVLLAVFAFVSGWGKTVELRSRAFASFVGWCILLLGIFAFSFAGGLDTDGHMRVLNLDVSKAVGWFSAALVPTLGGVMLHHLFRTRFTGFLQAFCAIYGFLYFFWQSMIETGDRILWESSALLFILVIAGIFKMVPSIITAVMIHRLLSEKWQYYYRVIFVLPMIIPGMVHLLIWKFFYNPTDGLLNKFLNATYGMTILEQMNRTFGWGIDTLAQGGNPGWLSEPKLIIPSLILWGFPWVGIIGVLIYLTGLQAIGTEVYEAADIDGINWFQKFTRIELPLIMTQVRISLVLLIIATMQTYGFILVLFGDTGGPDGVAMTPDLYMFRNAFVQARAGYACAIGLLLFAFVLILTEINNRYVRVEK